MSYSGCNEVQSAVPGDVSLIGCIGVLTVATRGPAGPGEVLVKIRGGREAFIAWSTQPIRQGSTVLIIESRGTRAVDVSEWTDPLGPFLTMSFKEPCHVRLPCPRTRRGHADFGGTAGPEWRAVPGRHRAWRFRVPVLPQGTLPVARHVRVRGR